ncbi:MAG: SPOR domain-containing protein [Pseudomonadota bacterium]
MKYLSVLAASAIAATGWAEVSVAQSSSQAVPAEFPPASYTGRQYVDSAGCVFIRAGIDNNVTWVPRLTRGRQQVCGFQPSLSASTLATVNAARTPAPDEAIPTATATPASAPPPAPTPAPAPRVVAAPAPAPAPAVAAPSPKPQPKRVVGTTRVTSASKCTNRSVFSQRYMHSEPAEVRCGPQSQPHVTYKDGPASPNATIYTQASPGVTSGQVRVAPKHVYENQVISTEGVFVPEGYTVVWEDDRLNTKRAHQTLAGKAQMEQIWTNTLPRRIKPGAIAGSGTSYAAGGVPNDVAPQVSRSTTVPSAAGLAANDTPASHRYVQIGAFTDPVQAKAAAQRLANSGLPTKMGDRTRGGKAYTLVVVGPYQTQGALDGGLAKVRGMGYAQATLKR